MIGPPKIPQAEDLIAAYRILQSGDNVKISHWAIWSEWVRFDPRLGELLVARLASNWSKILPIELNQELQRSSWPQCFGVLIEQVLKYSKDLQKNKQLFRAWGGMVMFGVAPRNHELFFLGTRAPRPEPLRKTVALATAPYRKWGFLDQDPWINKAIASSNSSTSLSPAQRMAMIRQLSRDRHRHRLRPRELVAASGGQVSLRVAQMDLKSFQEFKKRRKN
jgi:hypothetical protein